MNRKILGSLFCIEKMALLEKTNVKIKLEKIVRNLYDMLRKWYMNGTVMWKFLAVVRL